MECKVQRKYVYVLYDIKKGSIPGPIVIPESDPCELNVYKVYVKTGESAVVHCMVLGRLVATFYEITLTTIGLNFTKGVRVPLMHENFALNKNIYHIKSKMYKHRSRLHFYVYSKSNEYHPITKPITSEVLHDIRNVRYIFYANESVIFVIAIPGAQFIAFRCMEQQTQGLMNDQQHAKIHLIEELQVLLHPLKIMPGENPGFDFRIHPPDGSFRHFTTSSRHMIKSVVYADMYMRV
jgi:hypothetical protein